MTSFGNAWLHVSFIPADDAAVPVFNSKVTLSPSSADPSRTTPGFASHVQGTAPQKAFVYSDAYTLRRRIHKYVSFATVPLFIAQYIVGQKLYDGDTSSGLRSAHGAMAAGVGVLFGVNTITGAWNLWEGRKDANGRGKRVLHSILMLAADAGFLATAGSAPESEGDEGRGAGDGNRRLHRNVAIVSFSAASIAYVLMLLGS
jgi:hypothetical protein